MTSNSSSSNSTLKCRVRKNGEGYEGTVFMSGLKPTKLVKKDETSIYTNKSGVTSAAKAMANRLGLTLEVEDSTSTTSSKKSTAKEIATTIPTGM
jgi:hypothetical protein